MNVQRVFCEWYIDYILSVMQKYIVRALHDKMCTVIYFL